MTQGETLERPFPWSDEPRLCGLLAVLDTDGEEARIVGGAVRDALLGEPVGEWDLATTALPETVARRGREAGWKVVPTGIEHGTVTVVVSGAPFEVTTLREDVATDGRHALVRFGRDFRADALRRDFTINALSWSRTGTVHDYAGGLADLAARRVRFIGNPDTRIAEDYLRILRLFRFHARYGSGPIDRDSLAAAIRGRAGLARLSRERVHAEMMKILVAAGAADMLLEMDGAGLLLAVLGGVAYPAPVQRLAALETARGLAPDAIRRLSVLAVRIREDAARLASRLRLSNAQSRRLETLAIAGEAAIEPMGEAQARRLAYRIGRDAALDVALLAAARTGRAEWDHTLEAIDAWQVPQLPFGGSDLARLGVRAGPRVGRILAEAERRWIEAGFPAGGGIQADILAAALAAVD